MPAWAIAPRFLGTCGGRGVGGQHGFTWQAAMCLLPPVSYRMTHTKGLEPGNSTLATQLNCQLDIHNTPETLSLRAEPETAGEPQHSTYTLSQQVSAYLHVCSLGPNKGVQDTIWNQLQVMCSHSKDDLCHGFLYVWHGTCT